MRAVNVRNLMLCLVVFVALISVLSSGNYVSYVTATSWSSHSWSWTSHSWSWSSHSWSWTTGYGWNNYYNGGYYNGYYNGGYYPYQNYCNSYYYPSYYCNSPYPSYSPYQTATTTFTQQNYVTQLVTATDSVMVPVSFTSIMMITTTDNSAITFYGFIIAALLILVGLFAFASLFLLSKYRTTTAAQPHVASN